MEIKDIVQKAHDNAVKHGFWDPPLPFGTAIALIHSELSEALEEERAGNRIRPGDPVPMIYYSGGGYVATAPTKCCVKPGGTGRRRDPDRGPVRPPGNRPGRRDRGEDGLQRRPPL